MTVETTSRKQNFDGGQADLEFTFRALPESPEDIKCIATSAAGDITDLEYGVDYTVAVNSDGIGGTVTLNPTFATTYTHTVYRETTIKQESDYDDYNPFPADTLETNLDRLTLVAQELEELGERTLKYPISSTGTDTNLPVPEAGKYIAWNAAGDGMENKDIPDPSTLIKASQAEAEAGTDNDNFMTPLRTKQAITALEGDDIPLSYLSTSGTLAENSDVKVASQKATRTFVAANAGVAKDGTVNPTNLLSNGDFESWSAGASAAPDGWAVLGGTGGIVAKEGTIKKMGSYSASLTRNGINTQLTQYVSTERGIEYWKGRTLTFGCWVWCDTASVARIVLNERDGGSVAYSSFHPGDSDWHWLTATKTITTGGVTGVYCILAVGSSDKTAYFDGAMCVEGSSAFAFSPRPMPIEYLDTTVTLGTSDTKVPSQKAVKTYVDTKALGSWVDKSASYAAQQAATDGFVMCNIIYSNATDSEEWVTGYTDGNANPTTARARCATGKVSTYEGYIRQNSFLMPVKKGDYWKVVSEGHNTPTIAVYWIPFGG